MNDIETEIPIPTDNNGFVLLQCPLCGEFFKLKQNDMTSEDVIEIWCPYCGLTSQNYLTKDVVDLAFKMASNIALDMTYGEMKKQEQKMQGGAVIKAGNKPRLEIQDPIILGIDALALCKFECCRRTIKVKPTAELGGIYCPFCGVNYDEDK